MVNNLKDITLGKWIGYMDHIHELEQQYATILNMDDSKRKSLMLTKNYVDKAYATLEFFEQDTTVCVDDAIAQYQQLMELFVDTPAEDIAMPELEELTAGQFFDAKMIIAASAEKSKWHVLQYVIAIFCQDDNYDHNCTNEYNALFIEAGKHSLVYAIAVHAWFDNLNTQILNSYTLFQESDLEGDEGENMKAHMQQWGWVNLLKGIAKTKVFDIAGSGMNSIDCVRAATLDDVLTWASEEKAYNLAMRADMDI